MEDQVFNNDAGARPTGMKYGLIWGGVIAMLSLIAYNIGWMDVTLGENGQVTPESSTAWLNTLLYYVAIIVVVVLAIKHHRDNVQNGYITFGKCVGIGLWTGIIGGLISGLYSIIFNTLIAPGYFDEVMELTRTGMEDNGVDEATLDTMMNVMSFFGSPIGSILANVLGGIILGVIISLIAGIFLKRE